MENGSLCLSSRAPVWQGLRCEGIYTNVGSMGAEMITTQPVTISISKDMILARDVSHVRAVLDSFMPELVERNRNRVELEVFGYDDDPRELVLIKEVRRWYHEFFDNTPDLFLWMNFQAPLISFYAIMFGNPVRVAGGTTVRPEDFQRFLDWGFGALNGFCEGNGIRPDESNKHVLAAVQKET